MSQLAQALINAGYRDRRDASAVGTVDGNGNTYVGTHDNHYIKPVHYGAVEGDDWRTKNNAKPLVTTRRKAK